MMNWSEQVVLVTGGTGSFGRRFVELMLHEYHPQKLIIFSRDELKQHDMRAAGFDDPSLRYFIGDVRDPQRLERALSGVSVVVHAAALKQVPACEYNPFEAIQTNIMGGRHVIDAAINQGVQRILALSTDKAVNPINLYGATECDVEYIGIRAGEKLHEVLVSEDEARHTLEIEDLFVIQPAHSWWRRENWSDARPLPDGFRYTSDSNPRWLSREELQELVDAGSPASERIRLLKPQCATA